jgi:hypothetical protein
MRRFTRQVASGNTSRERLRKSLGRPGGNATGVTIMNPTITGTLLELLKEIAPRTVATRYVV